MEHERLSLSESTYPLPEAGCCTTKSATASARAVWATSIVPATPVSAETSRSSSSRPSTAVIPTASAPATRGPHGIGPALATTYDIAEDGQDLFIFMELVEGEPLSERLKRGPLTVPVVLRLAIHLLEEATRHDPNYAAAWSALGAAYDLKGGSSACRTFRER